LLEHALTKRLGERARFKRPDDRSSTSVLTKVPRQALSAGFIMQTFDVVRPQPPPADALILMSTPAGSDSLFNASIVFPVG
jgi:hypothetical protein